MSGLNNFNEPASKRQRLSAGQVNQAINTYGLVQNPMTGDLDANSYQLRNTSRISGYSGVLTLDTGGLGGAFIDIDGANDVTLQPGLGGKVNIRSDLSLETPYSITQVQNITGDGTGTVTGFTNLGSGVQNPMQSDLNCNNKNLNNIQDLSGTGSVSDINGFQNITGVGNGVGNITQYQNITGTGTGTVSGFTGYTSFSGLNVTSALSMGINASAGSINLGAAAGAVNISANTNNVTTVGANKTNNITGSYFNNAQNINETAAQVFTASGNTGVTIQSNNGAFTLQSGTSTGLVQANNDINVASVAGAINFTAGGLPLAAGATKIGMTPNGDINFTLPAGKRLLANTRNITQQLFANTGAGAAITNSSAETLIQPMVGIGNTQAPANALLAGTSWQLYMSGLITAGGSPTLTLRFYGGPVQWPGVGNVLLATFPVQLGTPTANVWIINMRFIVRAAGAAGLAALSSNGQFAYSDSPSTNQQTFSGTTINSSTFSTTTANFFVMTAQFSNLTNQFQSDFFTATQL